jgi:hypothetical protein
MKLGRLTDKTGVSDAGGLPTRIFSRLWDALCNAIEAPAAVTSPPVTAVSPGKPGQIAYDATHFYVCIATDVWVRGAIATW